MFVIAFILILALLVLIHEFGHFIAAKKQGILVEEFGFGFPPRVWGKKIGETLYSINLLPIGGFVKLYGEEYHEEKGANEDKLKDRAFVNKKPWQRAIVVIAGVLGNFFLAWVLISYLFTQGVPTPTNDILVESVQPNSPAKIAGLKTNDHIVALVDPRDQKQTKLTSSDQFISLTRSIAKENKDILFLVKRNGHDIQFNIKPRSNPPAGQGPLGVVITSFVDKKYPWYQAPFYGLKHSFEITGRIASELVKTIFQFATLKNTNVDVAGPIGIARYTNDAIKFGNNAVMEFIALLSLNLAVFNILPFPALDGGRLAFIVYEWVTKRRVNKKVEQYANMTGMALLLTLAAIISISDVIKLFSGK